jgi:hypothetical protein
VAADLSPALERSLAAPSRTSSAVAANTFRARRRTPAASQMHRR